VADQEPLETTSQDAEQLPERIRVHALAKLLGVTSKRILAKLTELGSDARSAQSNVDRAVAQTVRDSLVEPDAAVATPEAPASAPEPEPAPTREPGLLFSAPDPVIDQSGSATTGAVQPAHQPSVQLFTHLDRGEPHVTPPTVFEAAASVQAPLFLPPDAAAAEQTRRKRRVERDTRRTEEPPVEVEEVVEEEADTSEDNQDSPDQQGDADDQPRRRRRGRRGRGRGRGEQHSDADGDENDTADADTEHEPVAEAPAPPRPTRYRASPVPPGSRPSVSAGVTAARPVAVARRS
jgi:ribonuclease E